jgi:23S rRNA pseudouridine1911/1915/1917 synthase
MNDAMNDLPTAQSVRLPDDGGVEVKRYAFDVKGRNEGRRLDAYLAGRFSEYSRTFIKALIESGGITVNGRPVKPSYSPSEGDRVVALVPTRTTDEVPAEDIPLDILYEDDWIVVLNKPADLVVHPSRGHQTGTLVNALVYHFQQLSGVYGPLRPGVVHRLDRDTSGVILVIKDDAVHEQIARQFEERTTVKEYLAIVEGRVDLDGDLIDAPVGRHPGNREKMAIAGKRARTARTVYEVVERLGAFTVVRCFPRSGRTHQIRVHLAHVGHPIVADPLYGRRDAVFLSDLTGGEHPPEEEPLLARQALHARRLTIHHPKLERDVTFEAPLPADMAALIEALREHAH